MDFFDLHCDTLTQAMQRSVHITEPHLQLHFPISSEIKHHCQCMAIYCPDTIRGEDAFNYYTMAKHFFKRELKEFSQYFEQVSTAGDIEKITAKGKTAAVLTAEGGAVLNGKIENLQKLHNDGVKMLTLTWNGENELGCGSSNQHMGLTPFGIDAVKEMERLGMVIDVSHLSDAGLCDVLKYTDVAIAASHSNLRSECEHRRNLTDEHFIEIVKRGGIVGINLYKYFLNDNGDVATLYDIVRHIKHMLVLGGENAIAIGSDFDGCDLVNGINGICDMPKLYSVLQNNGISPEILEKFFWKNANDFFKRAI